ncbi:MAG: hypothetical protein AB1346_04020 [Thermodesulfobacteriota bacterium]
MRPDVSCSSRGDHRVAMSLQVLGRASGKRVILDNTACIDTSFPGFEEKLEELTR